MTRSLALIYNPHQAGWDEGYAAGLAANASRVADARPEWIGNQQDGVTRNGDSKSGMLDEYDVLVARDAQIVTLQEERDQFLEQIIAYKDGAEYFSHQEIITRENANLACIKEQVNQIATLQAALEPLAAMLGDPNNPAFATWASDRIVFSIGKDRHITVGNLRAALAAIKQAKDSAS